MCSLAPNSAITNQLVSTIDADQTDWEHQIAKRPLELLWQEVAVPITDGMRPRKGR
jgi:hypothetical protein